MIISSETHSDAWQPLLAMLHLASPQLPVGGFSYSQGLEAAVEKGLVADAAGAQRWIESVFANTLAPWELPTLAHLHRSCHAQDFVEFTQLNNEFIASRETRELREETVQMGWSLRGLIAQWPQCAGVNIELAKLERLSFPAAFAAASCGLEMQAQASLTAYAFAWAENQVAAAIKTVPLGQSAGQAILLAMHVHITRAVQEAVEKPLSARHSFAPMLTWLSAQHETQYSRLFRS